MVMRRVLAAGKRLAGLLWGTRRDRSFDAEIDAHLQMHIDDNRSAGMSAEEARRVALLKLGGLAQTREAYRDRRGVPAVETILKDLQFAARLMRRAPGFTAIVLLTLAVGVGANTAMFSVVNTVLLRPLPYPDPERLMLMRPVEGQDRRPSMAAPPDFYRYRAENRSFDRLDAFYGRPVNLTGGHEPERANALVVSSGFFAALGTSPARGRGFISEDEEWGRHRVAMLTDGLWQRRFAADPAIVGQWIAINDERHLVVGVLPAKFSFLNAETQIFVPMAFAPGDNQNSHNNHFLRMVGRLKPGTVREQALTDLNAISKVIVAEQSHHQGSAIDVLPLQDALVGPIRLPVLVLLGSVAFVLLICCANLASLLLARAVSRQREIAVRLALGATGGRLVRQFVIESLLLSLTGGAAGLALAYASTSAINLVSPLVLPRAEDVRVDGIVLVFTFGVATLTGVLLGLAPAAHCVGADPAEGLNSLARASDTGRRHRLRAVMVVSEVALSLVLLAGAGLMLKSFYRLRHVDAGFATDNVLTMQINLPPRKYIDQELARRFSPLAYARADRFFSEVIQNVRAIPGVSAVGAINGLPVMGEVWGKNITFFDRPLPADRRGLPAIQYRVVAGDYFRALGIRILSGRPVSDSDTQEAAKVAIVNRELVRRYWNGRDPLGQLISVNPPRQLVGRQATIPETYEPEKFTVIGVADDARYGALQNAPLPLVYVAFAQGAEGTMGMYLVVQSTGEPLSLAGTIRQQIARVDRDQPVASIQTMGARVAASIARPRLQTTLLTGFAAVAILLAAIGIYGIMSYAVRQRTKEIGIRLALGAGRRDVMGLVLRQGCAIIAAGVGIGLVAALLLARILQTFLFETSVADPWVFTVIVVLLAVTGWVAAVIPARRAARLDPMMTLRTE